MLKHILFWAVDEGWVASNPLTRYRRLPEPKRAKRILSVAEEDRILEVALPHIRQAVILALDTGMRRGEILSLRREFLDPHRRVLVVSRSKTAGGTGREIPWTMRLNDLLRPLAGETGAVVRFREASLNNLKKGWRRALAKAAVAPLRFHDLRHTFNTRLMEAGVSQDIRKALMGHADSDINDTYTHVELPAKRAAIGALERWTNQQRRDAVNNMNTTTEGGNDGALASENPEGDHGGTTGTAEQTH